MKKAIVIGGGIAGLSAGFFLQLYGFESEIFEAQSVIGGECTGWQRSDFHIDNCIHWLTGTKKDTQMYKLWEQLGALGDDIKIISPEIFYTSHIGNTSVSLYRNREKTRKELLDISPNDKDEINSFINSVKACECVQIPCDMPMDMMSKMQMMKLGMSMVGALKSIKKYGQITIGEFAEKFDSPILRTFFADYIDKEYSAISLIMSYASFSSGNADIPTGGSLQFSQRIAEKYKSMGGKIHTSSPVKHINVSAQSATGITLESGETVEADYVISCCDTKITFGKLLDEKYMPLELAENYKSIPVRSAFQVAFGVSDECKFINSSEIFECNETHIATQNFNRMGIRNYNYDPFFAPQGKTVLQSYFPQNESDYNYWQKLYTSDKEKYNEIKKSKAEEILKNLLLHYPQLENKITVLNIITPCTYNHFAGAYKGSYMGFIYVPQEEMTQNVISGVISGLDNVVLGTQWQQLPGGLPIAVTMGKFAAQRIANKEWSN